jgi:hypothetical protein
MKVTVTNSSQVGADISSISLFLKPGTKKVAYGCSLAQAADAQRHASALVRVEVEQDPSDRPIAFTTMAATADPAALATTSAAQGFTLKDSASATISIAEPVGLAVYDDAACTILSTTATLNTASVGTITSGAGTNKVEMVTAAGQVALTVTKTTVGAVYLKAYSLAGATRILDSSGTHKITFS